MNFSDTVYDCLEILSFGYTRYFPLLFIGWLFLKKHRPFLISILSVMNGWLAFFGVYLIAYWGIKLVNEWYSFSLYEGYDFYYSKENFFNSELTLFWWLCVVICCLLFLFKKWRKNIWLSAITLIIFNFYQIVAWYITLFRDYRPSAWRLVTETKWYKTQAFMLAIYIVIIFFSWNYVHAKMKSTTRPLAEIEKKQD